jgi:hypothetical protein
VFWQNIAASFEAASSKKHTTLYRAIDDIVKAQYKFLAEYNSGKESKATSFTDTVDNWISILDNRKVLEQARKNAKSLRDSKSQESIK